MRDGSPLVEIGREPSQAASGKTHRHRTANGPAGADLASPPELEGAILDERFKVGHRVGQGGMAHVYRAEDLANDGATVAVKVLSPRLARDETAVTRLRREAGLAAGFDHPNVCPTLAFGGTADLIYLVMPFLEGQTLSRWELRHGPARLEESVLLLGQICLGLQYAHEQKVVHRDVKPENVMLVPDEGVRGRLRAVVMDFGLAKALDPDPSITKLTGTGLVLGTPEFMSPEQIRGKSLDARSDVFSLAVLAFELLTGSLPYSGEMPHEVLKARLRGRPRALGTFRRDLPHQVEQILTKALTRDPAGRYRTMKEFARALAPYSPGNGYRIRPITVDG